MDYERRLYRCQQCGTYFSPVDMEVGVRPGRRLTPSLRRKVAWVGARASFEEASRDLHELLDVAVSPGEIQRESHEMGQRFEAIGQDEQDQWNRLVSPQRPAREPELDCQRLVVMADATCVLTVSGEEHKSVYCGRAFQAEARETKEGSERPFLADSRYTASGVNFEDFKDRLLALARRCGLRRAKQVAFVADGAPCLWLWAATALAGARLIQDFWHVCEHLSSLAQELYAAQWEKVLDGWKGLLLESRVDQVIAQLRQERRQARGKKRQRLDQEIEYLQAGRERMDYARYKAEGWPIGSGAIEATCKHLVKARFGLSGARWRRRNIPAILALRVAQANDEWDDYCQRALAA